MKKTILACMGFLGFALACGDAFAFLRYKNPDTGAGNCSSCHGDFTDDTSPKGTVFPSNNKHEMHRSSGNMRTACNLCHTNGDERNPWIGSSTGTTTTPGLGCAGCHVGPGLRKHHAVNGITSCGTCHTNDTSLTILAESVAPPYYGTVDTLAASPCNKVRAARTNENWSVGDFLGLDNDGNNVYDELDPACTPYRIVQVVRTNGNVLVTWETAGGRTDVLQAAGNVLGTFADISAPLTIPGSGAVTTNFVEVGGSTNTPARFYRLRLIP